VQRPQRLAARERLVGLPGAPPRTGRIERADRVQRRVMARDALEVRFDQLAGADAPGAQRRG